MLLRVTVKPLRVSLVEPVAYLGDSYNVILASRRRSSLAEAKLMTCNKVDSLITEYLEDAMPASARGDFEAHLAACPEYRGRLDETRALIDASHGSSFLI